MFEEITTGDRVVIEVMTWKLIWLVVPLMAALCPLCSNLVISTLLDNRAVYKAVIKLRIN